MKRLCVSASVILFASLILLGSGGFTIGKMICGGNISYSLGKAKDCCSSEKTSEESLSCCCELTDFSYSLDKFSTCEKVKVAPQEIDGLYWAAADCRLPVCFSPVSACHSKDPPPPPPGDYLHVIGSLLL